VATTFANGKLAFGFCDQCGFRYPLSRLKTEVILGKRINIKACPQCWDPDHPQNWAGIIGAQKVANDPQSLFNPRPDNNRNDSCSDFAYNPVATQTVLTTVNNVFITGFSSYIPGTVIVPPIPGPNLL